MKPLPIATLSLAAAYLTGYSTWYAFYGSFGLAPEQVGVSAFTLSVRLGASAVLAAIIIAGVAVLIASLIVHLLPALMLKAPHATGAIHESLTSARRFREQVVHAREEARGRTWARIWPVHLMAASVFCGTLVNLVAYYATIIFALNVLAVAMAFALVFVAGLPALVTYAAYLGFGVQVAVRAASAMLLVLFWLLGNTLGSVAAAQLKQTGSLPGWSYLAALSVSYAAPVAGPGGVPEFLVGHPLVLLGDSDQQAFLFDCKMGKTYLLPVARTELQVLPGPAAHGCKGQQQ